MTGNVWEWTASYLEPFQRHPARRVHGMAADAAWARPEGEVRVAVKEAPPFAWRDVDGEWEGLAIDLWRRVADEADLPRSVFDAARLERLLDAVAAGDADVGLGALSVTAARERRLDFTHPFFSSGLGVAVPARHEDDGLGSLLASLWSRGLGWLLGGWIVGLLVVGVLIAWAENRANPAFRGDRPRAAVGLGLWWTTTMALGNRGVMPQTGLGRLLAACAMATSLLLLSVFVGAIASRLTVWQLEERIRVLPLVIESEDYAFALAPDGPHREVVNQALLELRGSRWWRQLRFQYLGR